MQASNQAACITAAFERNSPPDKRAAKSDDLYSPSVITII